MRRFYWCHILPQTSLPYKGSYQCQIVVDYHLYNYDVKSLSALYAAICADGFQVWGRKDHLDYYVPRNVLEYIILRETLLGQGMSNEEIERQYLFGENHVE